GYTSNGLSLRVPLIIAHGQGNLAFQGEFAVGDGSRPVLLRYEVTLFYQPPKKSNVQSDSNQEIPIDLKHEGQTTLSLGKEKVLMKYGDLTFFILASVADPDHPPSL